jgi:hypothetical protein
MEDVMPFLTARAADLQPSHDRLSKARYEQEV